VDLVQRAYVGLEVRGDVLWFDPDLPSAVEALHYTLLFRGHPAGRPGACPAGMDTVANPARSGTGG